VESDTANARDLVCLTALERGPRPCSELSTQSFPDPFSADWQPARDRLKERGVVKKLLVGSAVTLVMAASAWSADLGPVYKAPPFYDSWAGPYLGAAVGLKWGNTTWATASVSDFPGETVDASSPRNFDPAGARIGGYGGYNWRHQAWIYGVEFDLAYANSTTSAAGVPGCACCGSLRSRACV
jgi:hypothetical protein